MKNAILYLPSQLTEPPSHIPSPSNNSDHTNSATRIPINPAVQRKKKVTILFFVTGNPGLIGYYDEFLALLAEHTATKGGRENYPVFVVAGASLAGFFSAESVPASTSSEQRGGGAEEAVTRQLLFPSGFETKEIYDLQDQINLSYLRLLGLVRSLRREFREIGDAVFEVILAGHSVGAYVALELVRLHHKASVSETESVDSMFDILATFLLTPTIHDISHSSSGRVATPILGYLPFFPTLVQLGASGLATTLPKTWMQSLVGRVTGMKNPTAIETTTDFLCLSGAVKQALYMAGCEMREIGEDQWTEEVWGAVDSAITADKMKVHSSWITPRHFFLFAKDDHWVANATREAIANKMRDRAVILIDNEGQWGLQHAWCLQQSGIVAGIVNSWVDELFDRVR